MTTRMLLTILLVYSVQSILDRSYYNILELPVSASAQEIRQAFRSMSKKYHPDRNPDSRNRFEKINVAYQCLYNSEKKYLYDRVGPEKMNDPNLYHEMSVDEMKGPELKIKLFLELKDFYLGKELDVMIQKQVACPHCQGTGAQNPHDVVTCQECNGKGRTTRRVDLGGGYYNLYTQTCPRCQGKGKVIGKRCHLCQSVKIIPGLQQFKIKVKPGTASSFNLRYENMGDERMVGAPSDIIFELVQISHAQMKRDGDNLNTELEITLQQAILGFNKHIVQLDGRKIIIQNDDITQPGQIFTIEEEGMPILNSNSKGNLYIKINVIIPDFKSEELNQLQLFFKKRKQ